MDFLKPDTSPGQPQNGFTLIELGIVLAVIGILSLTVSQSVAFIERAKVTKAMHHIVALRDAALKYSADIRNGVDFENLSLNSLVEHNYFSGNTQNAWGLEPAFSLIPYDDGNGVSNFLINYQVPRHDTNTQLATALSQAYLTNQAIPVLGPTPDCSPTVTDHCWAKFIYTP